MCSMLLDELLLCQLLETLLEGGQSMAIRMHTQHMLNGMYRTRQLIFVCYVSCMPLLVRVLSPMLTSQVYCLKVFLKNSVDILHECCNVIPGAHSKSFT